jgi:hypothetical protein
MLAEALQVDAYIARFIDEHDEQGRRLAVRNGSHASSCTGVGNTQSRTCAESR